MQKRFILNVIIITVFITLVNKAFAQPAWTVDLLNKEEDKPKQFEDKKLGSENRQTKNFPAFGIFYKTLLPISIIIMMPTNRLNLVVENAMIANKR